MATKPEAVLLSIRDQRLLREGYLEMAGEAKVLARVFETLDRESLRHLHAGLMRQVDRAIRVSLAL